MGFHRFLLVPQLVAYRLHLGHCVSLHAPDRRGDVYCSARFPSSPGPWHPQATKTGRSWEEYIRIEDARVLTILTSLLPLLGHDHPDKPLWRGSPQLFRSTLQHIIAHFAVEHLQLRGYSLRRGGATDDFERYGSLERTLQRGRWQSSRARLYLADGAARLTHLRLNAVQLARIRQYAALCTL